VKILVISEGCHNPSKYWKNY